MELDSEEYLSFGYSDALEKTIIKSGGTEVTHLYSGYPYPDVAHQGGSSKGRTFYISSAKVCEIDASCALSLPEEMDSSEATRTRSRTGSRRVAEEARRQDITDIRTFIETGNNIIANTPMLFIGRTPRQSTSSRTKGDKFPKPCSPTS